MGVEHRRSATPRISGGELFGLGILMVAAAGAAFLAQQHLAALQTIAKLRPLSAERVAGSSAAAGMTGANGGARESGGIPDAKPDEALPEVEAAAVSGPATAPLRVQSLTTIGELIGKRILIPPPAAQAAAAGGRGGSIPAYMVGNDGRVSPGFAQLFGLNDAEMLTLQEAALFTRQKVNEVIAANTSIQQTGDDAYEIVVRSAPEAELLRNQFESNFLSVLGPERYNAFALLNGERDLPAGATRAGFPAPLVGVKALMDGFGADSKTVTISKEAGRYTFQIRSGTTNGGGRGMMNREQLRPRLGSVIDLLPPGF